MRSSQFVLKLLVLSSVLISCENEMKPTLNWPSLEDNSGGKRIIKYSEDWEDYYIEDDNVLGFNATERNLLTSERQASSVTSEEDNTSKSVTLLWNKNTLEQYDKNARYGKKSNENHHPESTRNESKFAACLDTECERTIQAKAKIEGILKKYDEKLKDADSDIRKPKEWMLRFLSDLNAAVDERQRDYIKVKRHSLQVLMLSSVAFNSAALDESENSETQTSHDCTGKGLSKLLNDFIVITRTSKDKTVSFIKILRKKVYHYLHSYALWTEQDGADLFALFKRVKTSKQYFDEIATHLETEWDIYFESAVNQTNTVCRRGVTGIKIYDEIAVAWPRLVLKNDEQLDEEKLFKKFFPPDSPEMKIKTELRLSRITEIEAKLAKYVSHYRQSDNYTSTTPPDGHFRSKFAKGNTRQ